MLLVIAICLSWVPIVAVSGGAVGIVVGGLTLATLKPSFHQFLEKHLPVLKPMLSSLHMVKETAMGDNMSTTSMKKTEGMSEELAKATDYEVCILTRRTLAV